MEASVKAVTRLSAPELTQLNVQSVKELQQKNMHGEKRFTIENILKNKEAWVCKSCKLGGVTSISEVEEENEKNKERLWFHNLQLIQRIVSQRTQV